MPQAVVDIETRMLPNSRSSRGSSWEARATLPDGSTFRCSSRNGAPNELARLLVSAGVVDQPMQTYGEDGRKLLYYRSLHEAAKWTFEESSGRNLRRTRWTPRPEGLSYGRGNPENEGV
jgi:hypothetical protein